MNSKMTVFCLQMQIRFSIFASYYLVLATFLWTAIPSGTIIKEVYGFIPTTTSSSSGLLKDSSFVSSSSLASFKLLLSSSISNDIPQSVEEIDQQQQQKNHEEFLANCKILCEQRNLKLTKVKNARDLASAKGSTILPGRLFRMGRVSDATQTDIQLLLQELNIQTLIDLRSPTEWKDDPTLLRQEVFSNFTSMLWKERQAGKPGCLKELLPGQGPVKKKSTPFWNKGDSSTSSRSHHSDDNSIDEVDVDKLEAALLQEKAILVTEDDAVVFEDEEECTLDCEDPDLEKEQQQPTVIIANNNNNKQRRERHFVSLMNEFKYVKGTVSKVRKRDITKAIIKAPGAVFSRRVRASLKKPFLDEINGGGLPMLNELLLRFGAPGIKYVLELCADKSRHPIAFYCTAGKDRTGILAAIIYSLCGVPEESIVEDYTLSANVYAEMNDHQAMVGALSQRNLDAKTFLGAPAYVMKDTLAAIQEEYGSVEGYCTYIGFTKEQQQQLREACME